MKKFVSIAILAASLAVSAKALVIGADVGYLVDAEEEYLSVRLGHAFKTTGTYTHQLEAEVGYTEQKESGVKGEFIPVTLNYRVEAPVGNKLGFYFGAGAGAARTEVKGFGVSADDWSFAAQAFVGLSYQATEKVALHAGAKYIWIDDVKLLGNSVEVGDDVALSAGISYKF